MNWKTTVTGLVGGIVILVNKYASLDLPSEVIITVVICALALLTKDHDATGGNREVNKKLDEY
jgi:Na+-translocating ferredoxin:NAD+ oxidoreductase RnfD subunit